MPDRKFHVVWTNIAASDLENIISYISESKFEMSLQIFKEIRRSADDLKSFPGRGKIVPELKKFGIKTYREIIINVWRIIYRIEGDTVYILSVFDSRRNMEDILLDRLINN